MWDDGAWFDRCRTDTCATREHFDPAWHCLSSVVRLRSSRIVSSPAANGAVQAKIVDGDRQLWLRVKRDTTVSVAGAEGEPMLLFDRNGVFVNVRSLTAAADRIGHFRLSRDLNPHASPAWQRLTGGHSFLWHDHRLHALEPLAKGDARRTVIGRWSIPLSIDGRPRPLEGELTYIPPRPLWPWLLVAGALAAGVWLGLAVSESPAVGSTIGAALVVTVVVWAIRIGRESFGRPAVGVVGHLEIGLTCALGVVFLWGLLHKSADVRVFTALFVGIGAVYQGLVMFRVLTHSIALSVLPTFAAQVGVAVSLGLGAGLVGIVLSGFPERSRTALPTGISSTDSDTGCGSDPDCRIHHSGVSRTLADGRWCALVDGRAADVSSRGRPTAGIRTARVCRGSPAAPGRPNDRQDLGRWIAACTGWSIASGPSCRNCFFPLFGTPAWLECPWATADFCLIR